MKMERITTILDAMEDAVMYRTNNGIELYSFTDDELAAFERTLRWLNAGRNDTAHIPPAACNRCGGWTASGGMSQHSNAIAPVQGRTGCACGQGH